MDFVVGGEKRQQVSSTQDNWKPWRGNDWAEVSQCVQSLAIPVCSSGSTTGRDSAAWESIAQSARGLRSRLLLHPAPSPARSRIPRHLHWTPWCSHSSAPQSRHPAEHLHPIHLPTGQCPLLCVCVGGWVGGWGGGMHVCVVIVFLGGRYVCVFDFRHLSVCV